MPDPSDKAERLCAMFDSYCKTVLRNASRNEKRALANRMKREAVVNESMQYLFDTESHEDTYPSEQLVIRAAVWQSCPRPAGDYARKSTRRSQRRASRGPLRTYHQAPLQQVYYQTGETA